MPLFDIQDGGDSLLMDIRAGLSTLHPPVAHLNEDLPVEDTLAERDPRPTIAKHHLSGRYKEY